MADGTVSEIWNIINTGGVTALLFWNLYRYQKGDVLPRVLHNEITEQQDAKIKLMAAEVCKGMKDAVRDGMIEAHHELNGKHE